MKPFSWLLLITMLGGVAHAQIINAGSCSSTDVQSAFNSVVPTTTTVNIPAGTCHWTTQVTLTVPSGNTSLSVLGAGSLTTTGGGDATVIVDDYASNSQMLIISTNGSTSAFFRIAGITLEGGNGSVKYNGILGVNGSSQQFRMDHVHVDTQTYNPSTNGEGMRLSGCVFGVIDHTIFDLNGTTNGAEIEADSCDGDSNGNGTWADSTSFGSNQFLYMENDQFNSTFNNGFANDCLQGGKFVIRFSTMSSTTTQDHATGSAGDFRSCRAFEFYENTLTSSLANNPTTNALYLTGGTGLIWGNTATPTSNTGYVNFMSLYEDRYNNLVYTQSAPPNGWGYCGTHQTGSSSAWDENNDSSGYACIDQLGRGKGDLLTGTFPTKCDFTTGCLTYNGTWPNQALEPVYEWNDTWATVPTWGGNFAGVGLGTEIQANRDYYICSTPGAGSCTGFTGATGVGSGTLASRPSTCTTGVAYWATDQGNWNQSGSGGQGELYQCTATNTWTLYYTPYTYPHLLTQGQGDPPGPPTNLQAIPQ